MIRQSDVKNGSAEPAMVVGSAEQLYKGNTPYVKSLMRRSGSIISVLYIL